MPPFFHKREDKTMGRKKTKTATITYKGEEYALVFNLNVMETMQEQYGSVEAWGDLVECEEPKAKDIKFGFTAMLNEGIDIYNEENDADRAFLTEKQVGRIISEIGLAAAAENLKDTVIASTRSDEKN